MKVTFAVLMLLASSPCCNAYTLSNLTPQDILVIGKGLDELPRKETDANNLYGRIQQQLIEQDKLAKAQANAEAEKAKAKADADVGKVQTDAHIPVPPK